MLNWWAFWGMPAILRHVIVNLHDGTAVSGVLYSSRGRWLTIRQASRLEQNAPSVSLDGEVLIERRRVAFIQEMP